MMKRILAIAIAAALGMVFALECTGCSSSSAGNSSAAIAGQWNLYALDTEEHGFQQYSGGSAVVDNDGGISVSVSNGTSELKMTGTWSTIPASEWPDVGFDLVGYYDVRLSDSYGGSQYFAAYIGKENDGNYTLYLHWRDGSGISLIFRRHA